MHLEKSYQQLTLVDDAGKKHEVCKLLSKLIGVTHGDLPASDVVDLDAVVAAEVEKRVRSEVDKHMVSLRTAMRLEPDADNNVRGQRAESDRSQLEEAGAEDRKEANPEGAEGGSEGNGVGDKNPNPKAKRKSSKASKGKGRTTKS
jgi:hypothetical protein